MTKKRIKNLCKEYTRIDEIIARECPRYVKKEMCYHNKHIQAIIDTHADKYGQKIPIKQFPLGNKECDYELNKMNFDYESQLRNHFSNVMRINND